MFENRQHRVAFESVVVHRVCCSHLRRRWKRLTNERTNERTWENIFYISFLPVRYGTASSTLTFSLILFTTWQTPCGFILILMRFSCSCSALINKLTKWNFCIRNVLEIQTYSYKLMYIRRNFVMRTRARFENIFILFVFISVPSLLSSAISNNNNRHKRRHRCAVVVAFLIVTHSDIREYIVSEWQSLQQYGFFFSYFALKSRSMLL